MAKTVRIVTDATCDLCEEEHEATSAFRIMITEGEKVFSTQPRVIDTCETQADRLRALRKEVLQCGLIDDRNKPEPKSDEARKKKRDCPQCKRQICIAWLASHLVETHGWERLEMGPKCPDCDLVCANRAGMVNHRKTSHGFDLIASMVEQRNKSKKAPSRSKK